MARPQCVRPRRRAGVSHILHQQPRRRGDGDHLELPRHYAARPSGDLGGLARGLPPDAAVQVVELDRQLRHRGLAGPEVGQGVRRWRRRLPKARRRGESELKNYSCSGRSSSDAVSAAAIESRPSKFFVRTIADASTLLALGDARGQGLSGRLEPLPQAESPNTRWWYFDSPQTQSTNPDMSRIFEFDLSISLAEAQNGPG